MVCKIYVPINDSFLEEVDKRDQHISLCLDEKPGSKAPAPLDGASLSALRRLGVGQEFLNNAPPRPTPSGRADDPDQPAPEAPEKATTDTPH